MQCGSTWWAGASLLLSPGPAEALPDWLLGCWEAGRSVGLSVRPTGARCLGTIWAGGP